MDFVLGHAHFSYIYIFTGFQLLGIVITYILTFFA